MPDFGSIDEDIAPRFAGLVKISSPTFGALEFDASLSEQHAVELDVTDFPVERGANFSDHKRRKPTQIQIEGYITNTPLVGTPDPGRGVTAFQRLEAMADDPGLVSVSTEYKVYSNMALTSLRVPRSAQTGDGFQFTVNFKEIRIVSNLVAAPVQTATPSTSGGRALGKQNPTPAPAATVKASMFARGDDATGKVVSNFLRR